MFNQKFVIANLTRWMQNPFYFLHMQLFRESRPIPIDIAARRKSADLIGVSFTRESWGQFMTKAEKKELAHQSRRCIFSGWCRNRQVRMRKVWSKGYLRIISFRLPGSMEWIIRLCKRRKRLTHNCPEQDTTKALHTENATFSAEGGSAGFSVK